MSGNEDIFYFFLFSPNVVPQWKQIQLIRKDKPLPKAIKEGFGPAARKETHSSCTALGEMPAAGCVRHTAVTGSSRRTLG